MRDLTEEELKLAPDWATHYDADFPPRHFISVCFFDEERAVNLLSNGEIGGAYPNEVGIERGDRKIPREKKSKPFDITQHEWSDVIAEIEAETGDTLVIKFNGSWISIDKDDAIAIAKHFGLTAGDLK